VPPIPTPRIGFLYPAEHPIAADNWSGTPLGLSEGLSRQGVEVIPIGVHLPKPVRYSVAALARATVRRGSTAHRAPLYVAARTSALSREVRHAGQLTAIIALGTDQYDLERAIGRQSGRVATYDDGTFVSFARHEDSDLRQAGYATRDVNMWAELQAKACRRADACCASTRWAVNSMIADYNVAENRAHVVGMGHRPRVNNPERNWSVPRFLFVGADWQRKNGAAVLRAFQEIRRELPEATLDLVGQHPRIDLPGVTGHGFLPLEDAAAQAKLNELYTRSTAFVLPSRFDPSPIACLEAASAGLPVIATTEGGAGELLGDAALTVNPLDNDRVADAMRRLADPKTAKRMGQKGAERAAKSTWEDVAMRTLGALGVVADPRADVPMPESA
jgi:glycosyltransferase involved in cell wall biosynthesis